MMKKYLLFTFLLVFVGRMYAQDLHYTQFYNTPMNYNPSLTGIYKGDQRYMVSVRDQWRRVKVPYFTLSGSFDMKFYPKQWSKSFFSAGLIFNYDRQGDAALNLSNLNLAGSYSYVISSKNLFTVGALVGFASRGFDDENLKWDAQYNEITHQYDPNLPTLEELSNYRFNYLETGLGLNYRYQRNTRTHLTLGAAAFHLNRPAQDFNTPVSDAKKAHLGIRYALHGVANVKIASPLDIQINGLYQRQYVYTETVVGALFKIYLSQKRGKMFEFHLGSSYRFNDAIIPTIAVQYNDWYVGFNYDVTISKLEDYINHRGGPELHISYIVKSVPPQKAFKLCPIF
jgi:type IX secretion system PorP/SprF family membrane protein